MPNDRVFPEFRDGVAAGHPDVASLIAEVARDAAVFDLLERLPADSPEGIFQHRVIRSLDAGAVTPILLWLMRWPEAELPVEQRRLAFRVLESWLVRRSLARLTSKNVNQVVLELLKAMNDAGPGAAGDAAEAFLAAQTADSRLWPDDATVVGSLVEAALYRTILRPRLRMLLEALEDDLRRSDKGEGQPCPRNLTVEHVMPQGWREHWPTDTDDVERDRRVQRLGNLTLVTGKLNPALSNRPWTRPDAPGKRDFLLQHSTLKLNAAIVAAHPAEWTDADIEARTRQLAQRVVRLWPRPAGAPSTPVSAASIESPPANPAAEPEDHNVPDNGKYRLLWRWLSNQDLDEVRLTFADVEEIIGAPLPPSARSYLPPWYGYDGTALGRAIRNAGWKASEVNLTDERVRFVRAGG